MDAAGLPSLLMQAARNAAVADGLVKPDNGDNGASSTSSNKTQTETPNRSTVQDAIAIVSDASSYTNPAIKNHTSSPSKNAHSAPSGSIAVLATAAASANPSTSAGSAAHMLSTQPKQTSAGTSAGAAAAAAALKNHKAANNNGGVNNGNNNSNSHKIKKPTTLTPTTVHSGAAPPQSQRPSSQSQTQRSLPNSNSTSPPPPRSSSAGSSGGGGKKKGPPLRRGKWTPEEEAYAIRLILEFKAGLLPLTDGTTLRTFLSKLLNCDPMRISKKFVGSNCIGKQVFRRRTTDINRLTPEQIQQSRAELSELERRFLERVAQTNRVKSSGVNNGASTNASTTASVAEVSKAKSNELDQTVPPSPPWLRPPNGFKHGTGAASAAGALSSGTANRAALAGRALLQGNSSLKKNNANNHNKLSSNGSAGLLALMELQRRQDHQNLHSQSLGNSTNNLLASAGGGDNSNGGNSNNSSVSGPALAQIARNASAARMAGLAASGNSLTNLMLKTGLSRDQLGQLVKEHQNSNSSNSLANMMERQSSLDALMSLDFQSLQSIDNLANLIHTGGSAAAGPRVPKSGMKNWAPDASNNASTNSLAAITASFGNSNGNLSNLVNLRRLASEGRMESLIRSLSSNNVNKGNNSGGSNTNFNDLLQSMQNNLNGDGNNNTNNLFGSGMSALNLANMLRTDSSTGLTALRMQDGLSQRNSSVDDFLSLVASGDIPHQDPHLLNVPLQSVLQQQNNNNGASAAAQYLAHQQLLAQAANNNNLSLNRITSFGGMNGNTSTSSLLSQYTQQQQALAMAAAAQQNQGNHASLETLKRKFSLSDMGKDSENQGSVKR